jgi:ribose-phosphate pyrophosphokinase
MVDTAGTMEEMILELIKQGVVQVDIATTHPIMSGPAIERLDRLYNNGKGILNNVYVTNTITRSQEFKDKHLWYKEISIAELAARTIYNINMDRRVENVYRQE